MDETSTTSAAPSIRLDLGCGIKKREGFIGVDVMALDGVDTVCDLGSDRWPWDDNSVDEAYSSHMIEHLTWPQRVHFINELYRVLKPGSKCTLKFPHWASALYYGDPTHKEPMSEVAFLYWRKEWRNSVGPHVPYTCDFDVTWEYTLHQEIQALDEAQRLFAAKFYKEAIQEVEAWLTKLV